MDDNELIKHSQNDVWQQFETVISQLLPEDLVRIAQWLGYTQLTESDHWTSFANSFSNETWYRFKQAYQDVMSQDYPG